MAQYRAAIMATDGMIAIQSRTMSEREAVTTGRLNRVIEILEGGGCAAAAFAPIEVSAAIAYGAAAYDGLVFEAEHRPWDVIALRDALQYLLDRRRTFEAQTLAPPVTPLVRIPPNGAEHAQWHAKQALDLGAFGIVWPHISTVREARNAVGACRYPRRPEQGRFDPPGLRGDGPAAACRYWGVDGAEYYRRAGVWPLDPDGEILVAIMIEDVAGVDNLSAILDEVPGIGLVIVGEGDLSQELGVPRRYDDRRVRAHAARVLEVCRERNVAVGHPHVSAENAQEVLDAGYRFLMSAPVTTYPGLERVRTLIA